MSIPFYKKKKRILFLFFHGLFEIPNRRCNQIGQQDAEQAAANIAPQHRHAVRAMSEKGSERADNVGEHRAEEVTAEADGSDTEHFVSLLCSFDVFIITQGQAKVNTYFSNNECNYYLRPRSRVGQPFQKYHG